MKRIYLLILTVLTLNSISFAQKMTTDVMMFGVGIGPSNDYLGVTGFSSPALRLTLEKGMFEIGPGVLAIGGEIGTYYQTYKSYYYNSNYASFIFAGRAAYYYNFGELLQTPQFNAYAGGALGIRIISDTHKSNNPGLYYYTDQGGVFPHFGSFLGANYFLTKNIAGFVEAGYDMSWGTIGFDFTF